MKINLGCSDNILQGWTNVDRTRPFNAPSLEDGINHQTVFCPHDLGERWPFEDSSVDQIKAHNVAEHIDNDEFRGNKGKIWFMNEAHRVLKAGGLLDLIVPTTHGVGAFCDPTHVSFWTPDDKYYFCDEWNNPNGERGRLGPAYGITALFHIRKWVHDQYHPGRWHVVALLEAVK